VRLPDATAPITMDGRRVTLYQLCGMTAEYSLGLFVGAGEGDLGSVGGGSDPGVWLPPVSFGAY
jgi:hypothetical protein